MRIRAAPALRFASAARLWAASGMSAARKPGFTGRLQGGGISPGVPCITTAQQPVSQPPPARRKPAFFATTSIATKPVKPCDRGVLGALNLLPIQEQTSGWASLAGVNPALLHFVGLTSPAQPSQIKPN